jgi:hypothetical protein
LIDLLLEERDKEDEPRRLAEEMGLPLLVSGAIEFEEQLRRARERDLDVLEPPRRRQPSGSTLSRAPSPPEVSGALLAVLRADRVVT